MKIYIMLHIHKWFSVSGKLSPGKFPPRKLPPIKLHPGELPPAKFPPRKFPSGIFPLMFLNIPTRVFYFLFHYYHWYYLKNCFIILCSKNHPYCGIFLKNFSLLTKIVTYSKKFCWSSMLTGHYYIHLFVLKHFILKAEECDVNQFNQLGLNSSFLHRAIN